MSINIDRFSLLFRELVGGVSRKRQIRLLDSIKPLSGHTHTWTIKSLEEEEDDTVFPHNHKQRKRKKIKVHTRSGANFTKLTLFH